MLPASLARGIPIADVSRWLGHRGIEVTYRIGRHLMLSAWDQARTDLDQACLEAMAAGSPRPRSGSPPPAGGPTPPGSRLRPWLVITDQLAVPGFAAFTDGEPGHS